MGCIMSRCEKCNINIKDDTMLCPLCHSVIASDTPVEESKSLMYPDAEISIKKLLFVIKLMIFISVLAESVLILINYLTYSKVKWSLICGVVLLYANFTVCYSFKRNIGHRAKLFFEAITIAIATVLIDFIIGYTGWSLNYAVPITLMVLDSLIIMLMLVNISSWQIYLIYHFMVVIGCVILDILAFAKIIKHPLLTMIVSIISIVILVGILLFGEKRAVNELKNKFKI